MKHISCIIVDDEPLARQILEQHISDIPGIESNGNFKSAIEAHAFLENNTVDVIFLDVNMPKLSGINWVRQLKNKPIIILTTAYSEYAVEAFEIEALDFLMKPISFERMLSAVERAKSELSKGASNEQLTVSLKEGKRIYRIHSDAINYVQAFGDYVRVFTDEKTYIVKDKLLEFSDRLPDNFIQSHRSYVVNITKVKYAEGNHLLISSVKVPVSTTFKSKVMAELGMV